LKAFFAALVLSFGPLSMAIAVEEPQQAAGQIEQVAQIDINSANAATLAESLVGIGLTKAQDIVAYREMYGNFRTVDELTEVKGIGEATLAKIRHLVVAVAQ
jgi:competence protein ComEA